VAADETGRLLAVWSSYVGVTGFDLFGQRYAAGEALAAPPPPFVSALSASRLSLTWPPLVGSTGYQIYMDGAQPPDPPTALAPALSSSFAARLRNSPSAVWSNGFRRT